MVHLSMKKSIFINQLIFIIKLLRPGGYVNPPLRVDGYIKAHIKITVVQNLKNHGCCFYYLKFNPNESEPFQKLNRMSRPPWNDVYFQVWPLQVGTKILALRWNIKITVAQKLKNHGCCSYYLKFNPNASEPFQVT